MSNSNAVMDAIETILAWDLPDEAIPMAITTHTGDFVANELEAQPLLS